MKITTKIKDLAQISKKFNLNFMQKFTLVGHNPAPKIDITPRPTDPPPPKKSENQKAV